MLRIVIVEDEIRTRNGLKNIIGKYPELYTVVGEADNGIQGFDMIKSKMPDLVISDIKMPFCDGITMLKNLREEKVNSKFILLTGHAEFEYAKAAIKWQVEDYILKPMVVSDLVTALEKVNDKIKATTQKVPVQEQLERYLQSGRGDIIDIKRNMQTILNGSYKYIQYVLIYISTPLKDVKSKILYRIEGCYKDCQNKNIIFNVGEQKILIMSKSDKKDNRVKDLVDLNKFLNTKFSGEIGMLYSYSNSIDTIRRDYQQLDGELQCFLSLGTSNPIFINNINVESRMNQGRIVALEKNFLKVLYEQDYKQCEAIIIKLIHTLRQKNYNPGDILHLFHSLFNQLNQHTKAVAGDVLVSSYDQLIGELSVAKTASDILKPFQEILTLLENEKKLSTTYSLLVQKSIIKINHEYMNAITLKEIADTIGVTHIYLSQLFHKEVKKSFTEYILDLRMVKAKKMLKTSDLKVYEVALEVGYNDSKYFCTQFKKYTGLSPSKYKQVKQIN